MKAIHVIVRCPSLTRVLRLVCCALALSVPVALHADQAHYFYDELGRLVGVVDGQNNAAVYNYDEVGNLLSITRPTAGPPTITAIAPDPIDAGATTAVTITGTNLQFGQVTTSNPDIQALAATSTATSITANFNIPNPTTVGVTTVTVTGMGGATSTTVTVRQPTPVITQISPPQRLGRHHCGDHRKRVRHQARRQSRDLCRAGWGSDPGHHREF